MTNTLVQALAVSGTNLFAGTYGGGVFLSTNNGTSWTEVNNGLTNTLVQALAVSGTNLFAGTYGGGVFLSTNNGTSWTEVNYGLTYTRVQALAVSGTNLFAGTRGGGVFLTTNNGTSWTEVNSGLTHTDVLALAISGNNLFAGTYGGGVWGRPLSEMITSVSILPGEIPQEFTLEQNYPNPFNPITKIRFQVPHRSHVSLKVFDVQGKEVATLVNEELQSGSYETAFDGTRLSSGVYFFQLRADNFTQTKKFTLQK